MLRYHLRTLLIFVTAAALTCGGWLLALDSVRHHGRPNLVQLAVLLVGWGLVLSVVNWPHAIRRYKRCTLLIVFALVGLWFARMGYLERLGDVHRREITRVLPRILNAERESPETITASIDKLAEGDTALVVGNLEDFRSQSRIGVYDKDMTGRFVKDKSTAELWREVVAHQVIANRYDRAMFRPWSRVSEATDRPPGRRVAWLFCTWTEPSDVRPQLSTPLYEFNIRDPILLTVAVSLGGLWWAIRRHNKSVA
jgi:hypothetical protein